MKLFTKDIDNKLFKQFPLGSDLSKQKAVAKIFNPYGRGRWFLLNSDPNDPNYLWAIVEMGGNVEVGSVSRSELEGIRLTPFRLGLERDLGFTPINAEELYKGLLEGKFYKRGGMMAKGGQIGDSGTITDKNSLFRGKMGVIVGEFDNMWQVKILDNGSERTVLVSKRGIDIVSDEYADGGYMAGGGVLYLESDGISQRLVSDKSKATPMWIMDAEYYISSQGKRNATIEKIDKSLPDRVGKNYIVKVDKMAHSGYMDNGGFIGSNTAGRMGSDSDTMAGGGGIDHYKAFDLNSEGELSAIIDGKQYKIRYRDDETQLYDLYEDGKKIESSKSVRDLMKFSKGGYMAGGGKLDAMLKRYATKDVSLLEKEGMMAITDTKKGVLWGSHKAGVFEFTDRDGKSLFKGNKKEAVDFVKENYTVEGMKGGGKVKFSDKVKSISKSLLKRKKVPKSVQKDYGKTFSKAEAIDSAKRIAGAMRKKEKMSKGGSLTSLKKQLLSRIKSSHSKKMTDVNLDEKTKMALRDLWLDGILIKKSVKGTQDTQYTLKKKD